ncbi:MAG: peptide-modifying radical SAM enzyme CbpB [Candidatus Omnitrophota bacterium]
MVKRSIEKKGLHVEAVTANNTMIVDPENAFWAITENDIDEGAFIPQEVLTLYNDRKGLCDEEMYRFRFETGLTAVYIDPTDRCNANCSYCYIPAARRKQGRSMTQDELDAALTKIEKYFKAQKRTPVIIFHAAEPLLVKDVLFRSIDRFKDRLYFGIQTNALLLTKEDVRFIKSRKVSIGISIDAPDKLTNDRLRRSFRGGGNFKKAVQALEWFEGYKGLNVIATMTKTNIEKLPALVRFLHTKKVRCVLINPMRLTRKEAIRVKPDEKKMAKYFIRAVDEAIRLSERSSRGIIIGNFTNVLLAIVAPTARRLMCDISPCGGGRTFFTITATGDMIPCGEFVSAKGMSGGNIHKDSIESALRSKAFTRVRNRYVEKIEECNVCAYRNICGAPCPAELNAMGDMYQKSVFCEFYKTVIRYAFKLIAEGKEKHLLRKESLRYLRYEYLLD